MGCIADCRILAQDKPSGLRRLTIFIMWIMVKRQTQLGRRRSRGLKGPTHRGIQDVWVLARGICGDRHWVGVGKLQFVFFARSAEEE